MNRYLITGGSGFIGTNLVENHLSKGDCVLNLDIEGPRCASHLPLWHQVSLLDLEGLRSAFSEFKPTHVYHLAARTDLNGRTTQEYAPNVQGLRNIISICAEQEQLQRVLFASSRLVCRIGYDPKSYQDYCPTTPYGQSKVVGEKLIANIGSASWSWSIFRPTSIWGPWFGVPYRNFFDAIEKGVYFHPGALRIPKSFGFVGNSVFQISELMNHREAHGRTFYIGDYEPIDVLDFAHAIAAEFASAPPRKVPLGALRLAAKVGDVLEAVGLNSPLTSFRLQNLVTPMLHDFSDLRSVVGPTPYNLEQGIESTVRWIRSHG